MHSNTGLYNQKPNLGWNTIWNKSFEIFAWTFSDLSTYKSESIRFIKLEVLRHEIRFQSYLNSFRQILLFVQGKPPMVQVQSFLTKWPRKSEIYLGTPLKPSLIILWNEIFSRCCINIATTTATAGIMLVTQLCWRLKFSDDNWMSVTEHRSRWFLLQVLEVEASETCQSEFGLQHPWLKSV